MYYLDSDMLFFLNNEKFTVFTQKINNMIFFKSGTAELLFICDCGHATNIQLI